MKLFYVATDYARKEEARALAEALIEQSGGTLACSSRWIYDQPLFKEGGLGGELDAEDAPKAAQVAREDFDDIASSDIFIQLTSGVKARGGRHVELGYALAINQSQSIIHGDGGGSPLLVLVVGPREHAFHYLDQVVHVRLGNDDLGTTASKVAAVVTGVDV